jgi:signal transduction histidine kinase
VTETTEKVIGERRSVVLRDMSAGAADAKSAEAACQFAAETLAKHAKDIPFALIYLSDKDRKRARLAGAAGLAADAAIAPEVVDLETPVERGQGWNLGAAEGPTTVANLGSRFAALPAGPWRDPPTSAVVLPLPASTPQQWAGYLIVGISARLRLDARYRDFLELLKTQIATAIANARSYEEEKRRAEALAELDRAKTAFFSNVSHEFRTPLTLMLGPIADMLGKNGPALSADAKGQLQVVQRNSLRLLRLVNTMLDFSRIEAGGGPCQLPADRFGRPDGGACQHFPIGLRTRRARLARELPTVPARCRGLRRSRDVGKDRPQSPQQRLQVHACGRDRGAHRCRRG